MNVPPPDRPGRPGPADRAADGGELLRNLDAERRRLDEVEALLEAALAGDPLPEATAAGAGDGDATPGALRPAGAAPLTYEALTRENEAQRALHGWGEVDVEASLTPAAREELAVWRSTHRLSWDLDDVLAVGLAGVVGALASVQDNALDAQVRSRLAPLRETDLLKGWESDARRMPVDYTGPDFGGPGHRVRSAGHDLARPLAALAQIRDGRFRGTVWEDGVRHTFQTPPGSYAPVEDLGEALTLWLKHLAADFVTPLSLPLPGWTLLYDLPARDLRKLTHDVYRGVGVRDELHGGLNLRSAAVAPALSVLSTEAIVRTHVHLKAHRTTGSARLTARRAEQRTELLLAGHAVVAAACLGHALVSGFTGEGPLGLRHVNLPVLLRVGRLALQVRGEARARGRAREAARPREWMELLAPTAEPWMLDDAEQIDDAAAAL